MSEQCCPAMDLQWSQRQASPDHYEDTYYCASCGHVHRAEQYMLPLRFPFADRCVTCGGDQQPTETGDVRCTHCGLTGQEDLEIHQRFAQLHPDGDLLAAAEALRETGRYCLP